MIAAANPASITKLPGTWHRHDDDEERQEMPDCEFCLRRLRELEAELAESERVALEDAKEWANELAAKDHHWNLREETVVRERDALKAKVELLQESWSELLDAKCKAEARVAELKNEAIEWRDQSRAQHAIFLEEHARAAELEILTGPSYEKALKAFHLLRSYGKTDPTWEEIEAREREAGE